MTQSFCWSSALPDLSRRALGAVRILACLAIVSGAAATPSSAAPTQPPDISVGTCIEKGGSTGQPTGSPIRTCCLDGLVARGCYICDYKWENCVWDPAYRAATIGKLPTRYLERARVTHPKVPRSSAKAVAAPDARRLQPR